MSKNDSKLFFWWKKIILIQKLLWSHGLQFWHFCQMCFVSNPKDSRSKPKSLKSFASSRKVSFGNFRWRPRMPSWRNWSFTANRNFLGKTKEINKIVSSFKEFFLKKFYWSRRFQFWHPCRKQLPTSGTSLFRISKQSQKNVFFWRKKNILSQSVSLDRWNAVLTNLLKNVSPRKRLFLAHCPKVEKFWFPPEFLLRKVPPDT